MAAADRLSGAIAKNKDVGSVPPDSQNRHTTTPPIAGSIARAIAITTRQLIPPASAARSAQRLPAARFARARYDRKQMQRAASRGMDAYRRVALDRPSRRARLFN
jgi:hypothetical protein